MLKLSILPLSLAWFAAAASFVLAVDESDTPRLQLQHRAETIKNLVFTQDGFFAASAGTFSGERATYADPEFVRLWSCESRSILWTYDPNKGKPGHFAMNVIGFSAAGELLVDHRTGKLAGRDGRPEDPTQLARRDLLVMDIKSGSVVRRYLLPPADQELRLSFDRRSIALEGPANSRSSIACLDVASGRTESGSALQFPMARQDGQADPDFIMARQDGTVVRTRTDEHSTIVSCGARWSKTFDYETSARPVDESDDRWIAIREGGMLGGALKRIRILDANDGEEIFALPIDGRRVDLYLRPKSNDVWLTTRPAHEGNMNASETMLGVVTLNENPHFRQAPLDGRIQAPDAVCCIENRYVVAASSEATMAWCWDIQSLRCLWVKVPTCGSDDGSRIVFEDGLVHLSCGDKSDWYRVKDGTRVNKFPVARPDNGEFSVHMTPSVAASLRHLGAKVGNGIELQIGRWVTHSGDNVIFENGDEARFQSLTQDGQRALFASKNGIEVLNLSTGARVTLITSHGETDEWIAHSEDGYFEASAGGGRLLAAVSGLEAHPIDQFAERYNRPDILLDRLGTTDRATVDYLRERYQRRWAKSRLSGRAPQRPPVARVLSSTLVGNAAALRLSFQDSAAELASFQIYVNDVPIYGREGKPLSGRSMDLDATVVLNPGNNKIEVSCNNRFGAEAPRVLRYLESSAAQVPGKLYFLGIGVSDYQDPRIGRLNYAHKDALDLAKLFKEMKTYSEVKELTLVNGEATGAAIEAARSFVETASEEDTLILFVSGHGAQVNGEFFFLPIDAERSRLAETGVAFKKLEDLLFATKARRRLVLMDACASGDEITDGNGARFDASGSGFTSRALRQKSAKVRSVQARSTERFVQEGWQTDRFSANDLFRRSGAVVLSSCGANEESFEFEKIENGAFTRAVMDAFQNGRADSNKDGRISKRELRDFVRDRVRMLVATLTEENPRRQTPSLDRDNLEEPMLLPIVVAPSVAGGSEGGTYRKTLEAGALVWIENSQTKQFADWSGNVDSDGYASGIGYLSLRPTKVKPDILAGARKNSDDECGVMVRGRFDGRTTLTDAAGVEWERWWEDGVPSKKSRLNEAKAPAPAAPSPPLLAADSTPAPLVGPGGEAGYMRTQDGRAWVWNNTPRPGDVAAWEGAVDEHSFATGPGTLKWSKERKFVTSYVGAMERGRLSGRTLSTDRSGAQREVWWSDGRKLDGPPAVEGSSPAPAASPSPLARADGTAGYMKTRDGRAWVWNNAPRPGDEVEWSGGVDEGGFASGPGVLRWFKESRSKGSRFFTQYEGKTIAGRLDGLTVSTDASGSRTVRFWKNGMKQ